jgi:riboflavin kinase/FMN adenylyltransferase
MINIGVKPTINSISGKISIEAHILDFNGDIYGKALTIYFYQRIRDERKFNSIEELKEQLKKDKIESLNFFNNLKY